MSVPLGWLFLLVLTLNCFDISYGQYNPPKPTIEPLHPKGIRISIPHEDGITLVAYHVKFNDDFYSLEAGTIAVDVIKPKNGRWVYEDRNTRLKAGDIIYLWEHVVYHGLGYNLLDQQHEVKEFYNYDGTIVGPAPAPDGDGTCTTTSVTKTYTRDRESQELKPNNVCTGEIIFEENFDVLDTNRWKIIERFSTAPNFEFVVYKDDQENVYVQDGVLYIRPILLKQKYGISFVQGGTLRLNKCTEQVGTRDCTRTANAWDVLPPVISGRLNTKPFFNFMYGKIQVRAKLPRGDWIYPLITLESDDISPNATFFSSIVIAHSFGNPSLIKTNRKNIGGHLLQAGGHVTTLNNNELQDNLNNLPSTTSTPLWSNDYHVYELEWGRERLVLRVDGQQYGEQRFQAQFNFPAYVNLGLGVAGRSLFPDGCRSGNYLKPWRNQGVKVRKTVSADRLSPRAFTIQFALQAVYDFYRSDTLWLTTWTQKDKLLAVDYIKVQAL
ncbi:beta-1,3-glucan-binding protein 2-like isoform X1 [Halictus rubicundus]|uniref:beta-1,3-glucan-binding protein 2-like isoform X1 n=1 Tax=Halictus rubicundus TaxID=77578 RepID=UPI004035C44B